MREGSRHEAGSGNLHEEGSLHEACSLHKEGSLHDKMGKLNLDEKRVTQHKVHV